VASSSGTEGVLGTVGVKGFKKINNSSYFVVIKEVNGENIINFKLLKTDEQFLGQTFVIGSIKRFNLLEFW